MKRAICTLLAITMAWGGSLLDIGKTYAASQPVVLGQAEGVTVVQNADGKKTLSIEAVGEAAAKAEPSREEAWADQGESWSNSGAAAQTELRKTYEKNETLVSLRKDGMSVSFAPIMGEAPEIPAQAEAAEGRQLNARQTASNVLRIGPAAQGRPESIRGFCRAAPARRAPPAPVQRPWCTRACLTSTAMCA